ncbi:MAG: site-2 protease family protein [Clostridia bacterium]|nr:site-2 protease family protein [Clostridia bacterium]
MYGNNVIWIAAIAILLVSRIMSGSFDLMGTLLMLPGLILALTLHEYAHAKASDRLGDPTPEAEGRLTLNPLAHMDPFGTICLLFAGFGWGKPVSINPTYYRNPVRDSAIVAAAGPLMNLVLAFVFFILYAVVAVLNPEAYIEMLMGSTSSVAAIAITMLLEGAYLNLGLCVFNLLPFPPLDGSKIFAYFLKGKARTFLYNLEKYSWIIIIILFVTEIPSYIITPVVNWLANGMMSVIVWIMNLFV